MAWPNPPLIDDFNRADETPVAAPWLTYSGGTRPNLDTNVLRSSVSGISEAIYQPLILDRPVAASATIANFHQGGGSTGQLRVGVCANLSIISYYYVAVEGLVNASTTP